MDSSLSEEVVREAKVLSSLSLVMTGLSIWDVCQRLVFDLSVLRHRRPYRKSIILYIIANVCMVAHTLSFGVLLNAIAPVDCQTILWVAKASGAVALIVATTLLIIRTLELYSYHRTLLASLFVINAGQTALWAAAIRSFSSTWVPTTHSCSLELNGLQSLFTAAFGLTSFLILVLIVASATALLNNRTPNSSHPLRDGPSNSSTIFARLFGRDLPHFGIFPFILAFMFSISQTVICIIASEAWFSNLLFPVAVTSIVIISTRTYIASTPKPPSRKKRANRESRNSFRNNATSTAGAWEAPKVPLGTTDDDDARTQSELEFVIPEAGATGAKKKIVKIAADPNDAEEDAAAMGGKHWFKTFRRHHPMTTAIQEDDDDSLDQWPAPIPRTSSTLGSDGSLSQAPGISRKLHSLDQRPSAEGNGLAVKLKGINEPESTMV